MSFRLRAGLHCCVCDDRPIFLDIKADRYFCLPFAIEGSFLRIGRGEAEPGDREALGGLISRGLLVDDDRTRALLEAPAIASPTRDLIIESAPGARPSDVMRAAISEAVAGLLLWRLPLSAVLARAGRPRRQEPRGSDRDLRARRIASAWARPSLLLRATDRCLVRAIALHRLCKRAGIPAQLIFGVRINPFGAHCWVQLGDAVLVGEYEQVRLFTPIMAVL